MQSSWAERVAEVMDETPEVADPADAIGICSEVNQMDDARPPKAK